MAGQPVPFPVQLPSLGEGCQLPPVGQMLSEAAVSASTGPRTPLPRTRAKILWGHGEVGTLRTLPSQVVGLARNRSGEERRLPWLRRWGPVFSLSMVWSLDPVPSPFTVKESSNALRTNFLWTMPR